jgi:hypothetical protein
MTDTMISQNIGISFWDTLYSNLYKLIHRIQYFMTRNTHTSVSKIDFLVNELNSC